MSSISIDGSIALILRFCSCARLASCCYARWGRVSQLCVSLPVGSIDGSIALILRFCSCARLASCCYARRGRVSQLRVSLSDGSRSTLRANLLEDVLQMNRQLGILHERSQKPMKQIVSLCFQNRALQEPRPRLV